ncbi:MAG: helix-turn-helix transcriptional regulator [Bifidobacteriaceae bacterium]|jgi:transcriptional regulator with XRE-family HTH domain|nr:helix-turn-helix transcriptional regulator [Bifidobacteriaceae bacterium]
MPHVDINQATALALRAERAISGMTLRDLARASGVPRSTLVRVLDASREIRVTTVDQLAEAMGIPALTIHERAYELMRREGGAARPPTAKGAESA